MSAPSNSLQQPRVRRSTAGSPGSACRLHPLRATVPYQLLSPGGRSSSPTQRTQTQTLSVGGGTNSTCISNPASPILNSGANGKQRHSPENKDSGSPDSAVCRVERSKFPVRGTSAVLRTSSLDAITGPYLTGQWPRDTQGPYSSCMKDKATQVPAELTPGPWIDEALDQGSPHQRSASWGSADHLKEIAKLRLQLQRSKQVSRQGKDKEHGAPQQSQQTQYSNACPPQPKAMSSSLSVPKCLISRVPSHVEGINHELENVFIREDGEQSLQARDVMDGRRAPFPPHRYGNGGDTRDTDTQAPSSGSDSSPSPRPGSPDGLRSVGGSPCSVEDADKDLPKFATSPKPNNSYMFKREPPEGCERVKVFEELGSNRSKGFPLFSCPDKNKVNFIPRGSAFCPVKLCPSLCSSSSVAPSSYTDLGFHGNPPATTPTIRIKDTDAAGAGATDGSTDTTDTISTDPGSEGSIAKALVASSS
ncbi:glucocorticoid-induced transcript 1 protein isoform X2 [Gadus chalcogrammus]|uniref:glucocorticoid-induced transcript 1 protein isoform X2 n=1 Tax=Gadus chalcogrammus TaxID=1042646 RepID=UPI0024C480EF|nr:glucocorticoid-induced transcript 1 protein isoform X2 [Gadus chalcogrammus]